jgi:hypothetical protein
VFHIGDLIKINYNAYEGAFEDDIGFVSRKPPFDGYVYVHVFRDDGLEILLKTEEVDLYEP